MYQITLTPEQKTELNRRAHEAGVLACVRDRLEMLRLSDAGWGVPRIAVHLDMHHQTVRYWVKAFLEGGFDALSDKPHGGVLAGKVSRLTPEIMAALKAELTKGDRTWTAAQIRDWLAEHQGVYLSVNRLRVHLWRAGLRYKRTVQSLDHKQDPQAVAEARLSLETLEKGGMPGSST